MGEDVIAEVMAEADPGSLVTKWVMVAELMSPDGTRCLARTWSDSCTAWDITGMLSAAMDEDYWGEDED